MGEKYKLLSKTFYGERVCSDMSMKFTKFTCDEDIVNHTMKTTMIQSRWQAWLRNWHETLKTPE